MKELKLDSTEELAVRRRVEEQKRYVESLRQEIQAEQRRAEGELDREQAQLQQQYSDSRFSLLLNVPISFSFKSQNQIGNMLQSKCLHLFIQRLEEASIPLNFSTFGH